MADRDGMKGRVGAGLHCSASACAHRRCQHMHHAARDPDPCLSRRSPIRTTPTKAKGLAQAFRQHSPDYPESGLGGSQVEVLSPRQGRKGRE